MPHDVSQDVDRDTGSGGWGVDVVDSAIERSVGIHIASSLLHFLIDASLAAFLGPLEEHVLQHMR